MRTRCLVFKRMRGIIELLSFCTHAHIDLVCPRGYDFGMRRRRSNWHAHTQMKTICICAGHFDMRTRNKVFMRVGRSFFYADMPLILLWQNCKRSLFSAFQLLWFYFLKFSLCICHQNLSTLWVRNSSEAIRCYAIVTLHAM